MKSIVSLVTLSLMLIAYSGNCLFPMPFRNLTSDEHFMSSSLLRPPAASLITKRDRVIQQERKPRADSPIAPTKKSMEQKVIPSGKIRSKRPSTTTSAVADSAGHTIHSTSSSSPPSSQLPTVPEREYEYMEAITDTAGSSWRNQYNHAKFLQRQNNPLLKTFFLDELRFRLKYRIPSLYQENLPKIPKAIRELIIKNTFYDQINIGVIAEFFEIPENIMLFVPEFDASCVSASISALLKLHMNFSSMPEVLDELCIVIPDLYLPIIIVNENNFIEGAINGDESDDTIALLLLLSNVENAVAKYNKFKRQLEEYAVARAVRLYAKADTNWHDETIYNFANLLLCCVSTKPSGAMSAMFDFFMPYITFDEQNAVIKNSGLSSRHYGYLVQSNSDSHIVPISMKYQGDGGRILFDLTKLHGIYRYAPEEDTIFLRKFIHNYHRYLFYMRILQIPNEAKNYVKLMKSYTNRQPVSDWKLSREQLSSYVLSGDQLKEDSESLALDHTAEYFLDAQKNTRMATQQRKRQRFLYNLLSFIFSPENSIYRRLSTKSTLPSEAELQQLVLSQNISNSALNTLIDTLPDMQGHIEAQRINILSSFVITAYNKLVSDNFSYFSDCAEILNLIFCELSDLLKKRQNSSIKHNDVDQHYAARTFGHILSGFQHCWIGIAESCRLSYDFILDRKVDTYPVELCIYQAVRSLFYKTFQYRMADGTPYAEGTMCIQRVLHLNNGNFGLPTSSSYGYGNGAELANHLSTSPPDSVPRKIWDGLSLIDRVSLTTNSANTDNIVQRILREKLFTVEHLLKEMIGMTSFPKAALRFRNSSRRKDGLSIPNDCESRLIETRRKDAHLLLAFEMLTENGILVPLADEIENLAEEFNDLFEYLFLN
ncbi:MAG: hypothetical protein LBJ19_00075 [Holosporaceae bacterium]|jgi:hypothetical protein|nr:hypothetical protein [Holosporaceae bacterium]